MRRFFVSPEPAMAPYYTTCCISVYSFAFRLATVTREAHNHIPEVLIARLFGTLFVPVLHQPARDAQVFSNLVLLSLLLRNCVICHNSCFSELSAKGVEMLFGFFRNPFRVLSCARHWRCPGATGEPGLN